MSKLFKQISLSIGFMGIVLLGTSTLEVKAQGTSINGIYLPEEMSERARQYIANLPLDVNTKITREDVVKALGEDLGFTWPLKAVSKNLATVKADIDLEVKQRCDLKYPPVDADKFLDLLKRRYGTYKVGDWVSVQTHHVIQPYKGVLTFIGDTYIKVEDTPILVQDIKDKLFLTRLNKTECERRINEGDQRYKIDRDARYKAYQQKITPIITINTYRKAGYINTDLKKFTGQWFEPITFVIGAYDLMSEELIRRKIAEGIELKTTIPEPVVEEKEVPKEEVTKENAEEKVKEEITPDPVTEEEINDSDNNDDIIEDEEIIDEEI